MSLSRNAVWFYFGERVKRNLSRGSEMPAREVLSEIREFALNSVSLQELLQSEVQPLEVDSENYNLALIESSLAFLIQAEDLYSFREALWYAGEVSSSIGRIFLADFDPRKEHAEYLSCWLWDAIVTPNKDEFCLSYSTEKKGDNTKLNISLGRYCLQSESAVRFLEKVVVLLGVYKDPYERNPFHLDIRSCPDYLSFLDLTDPKNNHAFFSGNMDCFSGWQSLSYEIPDSHQFVEFKLYLTPFIMNKTIELRWYLNRKTKFISNDSYVLLMG